VNTTTRENLLASMRGEAFAHAKYTLYAEQARRNGHEALAELYEQTANVELHEHFKEEAELAGLPGTDADNLRDAIGGESYEVETMYREFAEQARAVGETAAAERFEEVRSDELKHRRLFEAALAELGTPVAASEEEPMSLFDKVKDKAEDAVEKAKDLGEGAVDKAKDLGEEVVDKAKDVVDRDKPPEGDRPA
jgi:rubrerythrin